jgi:hypothetical protein
MDYRCSGQTVEVLIYDEAMRVEQAEDLLVANQLGNFRDRWMVVLHR